MFIKFLKIINILCIALFIASGTAIISTLLLIPDGLIPYLLLILFGISIILLIITNLGVKHYFCSGADVNITNYLGDIKKKLTDKIFFIVDPASDTLIVSEKNDNRTLITVKNDLTLSKLLFVIKKYRVIRKTSIAVLYKDNLNNTEKTDSKLISLILKIKNFNFYFLWAIPIYILIPLDKQEKDKIFCIESDNKEQELQGIFDNLKNPGRVVNNLDAIKEYKNKNVYFMFFAQSESDNLISSYYSNFINNEYFLSNQEQFKVKNSQINFSILDTITLYEISNISSKLLYIAYSINFAIFVFFIISFILAKNNCLDLNNTITTDLRNYNDAQKINDFQNSKIYLEVLKKDLTLLTMYEENGVDIQHGFGFYDSDKFIASLKKAIESYHEEIKQEYQNITIDSTSLFAVGKYEITNSDISELINSLYIIRSCSDCEIMIIGHTDNIGNEKSNYELSEKRALAVKKWMVEFGGVDQEKIMIKGLGSSNPIADNGTEEGRKKNRRVEIILIPHSLNKNSEGKNND